MEIKSRENQLDLIGRDTCQFKVFPFAVKLLDFRESIRMALHRLYSVMIYIVSVSPGTLPSFVLVLPSSDHFTKTLPSSRGRSWPRKRQKLCARLKFSLGPVDRHVELLWKTLSHPASEFARTVLHKFDAGKSNSTFGRTGEIKVPDNLVAKTNINLTMFLGRLGWRGLLIPVKKVY